MAYKQHTHCMSKEDFDSFWNTFGKVQDPYTPLIAWAALWGMVGAFFGALVGAGLGGGVGAAVGAAFGLTQGGLAAMCDAWLNRRLICVSGDHCAVGRVAFREFVEEKDYFEALFDNDVSLNLRFLPYDGTQFSPDASGPDYDWTQMKKDGFPGVELVEQAFPDLSYQGYLHGENGKEYPNNPGGRWTMHCEFEGNAMVTICKVGKVVGVFTTALAPLLIIVGAVLGAAIYGVQTAKKAWKTCRKHCKIPILCHIACGIAAFFAGIAGAAAGAVGGALAGPGLGTGLISALIGKWFGIREDGSFADAAADPASGTLEQGDCIFLTGTHVYDAGHPEGWHELHPVKLVQKICTHDAKESPDCCPQKNTSEFDASVKDSVQLLYDRWCKGFQVSQDPIVISAQGQPENQWCLHPLIDGCARRQEIEKPIG